VSGLIQAILTPFRLLVEWIFSAVWSSALFPAFQKVFESEEPAGLLDKLPTIIFVLLIAGGIIDAILNLHIPRRSRPSTAEPMRRSAEGKHGYAYGAAAPGLSDGRERAAGQTPPFLCFTGGRHRVYGNRRMLRRMRRRMANGQPPMPKLPTRSVAYRFVQPKGGTKNSTY